MEKKNWFRWLRIIGTGLSIVGVSLPWFQLGFEPHPTPIQWSGLEDIWDSGSLGIELLRNGIDIYSTTVLLESLCGIGLIFYFSYSIFAIGKALKGKKTLSLLLIGSSMIFLFNSQSAIIGRILFGFWLFIFGLLLSAIVEWVSSSDVAAN